MLLLLLLLLHASLRPQLVRLKVVFAFLIGVMLLVSLSRPSSAQRMVRSVRTKTGLVPHGQRPPQN